MSDKKLSTFWIKYRVSKKIFWKQNLIFWVLQKKFIFGVNWDDVYFFQDDGTDDSYERAMVCFKKHLEMRKTMV